MKKFLLLFAIASGFICVNGQENYKLSYQFQSSVDEGDYATLSEILLTDSANIVIPDVVEHDGFTFVVRHISPRVINYEYLRKITLPNHAISLNKVYAGKGSSESYTSVGVGFLSNNLKEVHLNEGLKEIGPEIFSECFGLKFIEIPSTVMTIDDLAFHETGLKTAIIHCAGEFSKRAFSWSVELSIIIYTNSKAPANWVATTRTYVPDKEEYSTPYSSLTTTPHIIEMITFNENSFEYTGNVPNVTWTNNVEGYTATLDMKTLSADAGSHVDTIPATFTDGEHTFTAKIPYRYTITPVTLHAKVNNLIREYGEENPQFNISYSGFLSGDNENVITTKPTVFTSATKTSDVGEYPITLSGGIAKNYVFSYEPGVLTVAKAPLSARVNDVTKVYGAEMPAFTIEYNGLKNGEIVPTWTVRPSFQSDATQGSNVGQYEIRAVNGVPVNYELGEIIPGTISITPAQLIIKANDATRMYYETQPDLKYSISGFVNGDTWKVLDKLPWVSTTATLASNVGTYELKVGETSSLNYSITYINGTLTITPRPLIASVENYSRYYNEDNPTFEVKYEGFVGDEDERVLAVKASATTNATRTSDVGTYEIKVSGGDADNYKFTYVNGLLTINKAEQIISWEQELNNLKVGDQVELKAVASSGLPITYTVNENSAAEIYSIGSKYYLDCKSAGEFQIVAVQEGNKNYYSSPRIRKSVIIGIVTTINSVPSTIIKKTSNGIRVTGTDTNDVIQVYSTDGRLLKSVLAKGQITDVRLAVKGVYIIKVGKTSLKISF